MGIDAWCVELCMLESEIAKKKCKSHAWAQLGRKEGVEIARTDVYVEALISECCKLKPRKSASYAWNRLD